MDARLLYADIGGGLQAKVGGGLSEELIKIEGELRALRRRAPQSMARRWLKIVKDSTWVKMESAPRHTVIAEVHRTSDSWSYVKIGWHNFVGSDLKAKDRIEMRKDIFLLWLAKKWDIGPLESTWE